MKLRYMNPERCKALDEARAQKNREAYWKRIRLNQEIERGKTIGKQKG
jgi:hypothetical protein